MLLRAGPARVASRRNRAWQRRRVGVAAAPPEPGQSRAATRLERGVAGPSSVRAAREQGCTTALGRNGRAVRRRRGEQGPRQGRGGAGFTITEGVC